MKNIKDLTESLMDTLEKVKEGKMDVATGNTVANLGKVILDAGKTELQFLRHIQGKSSAFLETPEIEAERTGTVQKTIALAKGKSSI